MINRLAARIAGFTAYLRAWLVLLALISQTSARADVSVQRLVQTDGPITSMALLGNTLYLSGPFITYVGPYTGSGLPLDPLTGEAVPGFPAVEGTVYAVAPDGQGGWFIGGSFYLVGGVPRSSVARVRADLTVDPTWNPYPYGVVRALAVAGTTVYAGGDFGLVALDASTGQAKPWCSYVNGTVRALAVSGGSVYAGGDFTLISTPPPCSNNVESRHFLAAFDAVTGYRTLWNPNADGHVYALAASGSMIYAGGEFLNVGGQARAYLAALDLVAGTATSWNPSPPGNPVKALVATGSAVFTGGSGIRAIAPALSGTILWSAAGDGPVLGLAGSGNILYAGGEFVNLGGQGRSFIAALDATNGQPTTWNPRANAYVCALAADGNTVFAGGRFTSAAGESRKSLAAVNTTTGEIMAWNPNPSGTPGGTAAALAASGSVVYIGGKFGSIGGATRDFLAAVDATTGAATPWNANVMAADYFKAAIGVVALSGSTLYVAGQLISDIGGATRVNEGAVDVVTALATPWDPNPPSDYSIRSMTVAGGFVYAGGEHITPPPYDGYLAALDATSGVASSWGPNPDGPVFAVASGGSVVYAGGEFGTIGGAARLRLAALDATSGTATSWNSDATGGPVYALALDGGRLYAGGAFNLVGGEAHYRIAAVDAATGAVNPWDPQLPGDVRKLLASAATVYAGGHEEYDAVTIPPRSIGYVAAIPAPTPPVGVPGSPSAEAVFALYSPVPSPLSTMALLAFDLPATGRVWLDVFDARGRRVVGLLDGREQPAGHNVVRLERGSMAAGLYFARLRMAGREATKKVVVIPSE